MSITQKLTALAMDKNGCSILERPNYSSMIDRNDCECLRHAECDRAANGCTPSMTALVDAATSSAVVAGDPGEHVGHKLPAQPIGLMSPHEARSPRRRH